MPKKKNGFLYEVHPTPVKGKDGRNIVYAKPAKGHKLSMKAVDEYCHKHYNTRNGEIEFAFKEFLKGAAELMAMGYRIDTPIGSFVPKLGLKREITNADDVKNSDVVIEGVDYNSGKIWNKALEKWLYNGFRRADNPNVQALMQDKDHLEKALKACLRRGYATTRTFAIIANITLYSARKQLEAWTKGENPKLMKSRIGQTDIYIEI